jgi:hypothetical protein
LKVMPEYASTTMPSAIRMTAMMVFGFILNLQLVCFVNRSLHYASSLNQVDQDHNDGNYQQEVNQPAHRVTGHQTQQPQSE